MWSVGFSPSGKFMATGSYENVARVWNLASGQCTVTLKVWGKEGGEEKCLRAHCAKEVGSGQCTVTLMVCEGGVEWWEGGWSSYSMGGVMQPAFCVVTASNCWVPHLSPIPAASHLSCPHTTADVGPTSKHGSHCR